MKLQGAATPVAIPTVYKGIQLKSRLEAQAAFLFDALGWVWEYEPQSFMLPNGVSYTPDFLIPDLSLFVECRGYDSEKGRRQLEGFPELMAKGIKFGANGEVADKFLILLGDREACFWDHGRHTGMALLIHCNECGWRISRISGETCNGMGVPSAYCDSCIAPMEISHKWGGRARINRAAIVTAIEGKILVNGFGVEEWSGGDLGKTLCPPV